MSRLIGSIIFLFIFLAIDIYVFQGFKVLVRRWLPDHSTLLNIIYWAIPISLLLLIIGTMVWHPMPTKSKVMLWSSSLLFGIFIAKFIWLIFMILDDVVRLVKYGGQKVGDTSVGATQIPRSHFIVGLGGVLAGTVFGTMVYGIAKGAHDYTVNNQKLKLKNLPKAFAGFKIVQISDVHAGSFWSKESVKKGVQMILDQKPDAIFFTGDLVNSRSDEFVDYVEIFGKLEAPHGVYSVLGNHDYGDYYRWPDKNGTTKEQNLQKLKDYQAKMGWDLLMNDSRVIEKEGEKLAILGVENWSGHMRFPKYGKLEEAYADIADIENKLLLSHDPSHWRAEVIKKYPTIDAMFAGHTHGMQFGVNTKYYKWSPVKYQYPEWAGFYKENGQQLYVNTGFGYLGYPGRVGFLPEITVFELETA